MRSANALRIVLGIFAAILASGTLVAFAWAQAPAPPGPARVAAIETTAPLQDHSEASIKAAIKVAAATAVRGALAMGLPRIQFLQALVHTDMVSVQILATDTEAGGERVEPEPGRGPGPRSGQPPRLEL